MRILLIFSLLVTQYYTEPVIDLYYISEEKFKIEFQKCDVYLNIFEEYLSNRKVDIISHDLNDRLDNPIYVYNKLKGYNDKLRKDKVISTLALLSFDFANFHNCVQNITINAFWEEEYVNERESTTST